MTNRIDELSKVLGEISTHIKNLQETMAVVVAQGNHASEMMVRQDMTNQAFHKRLDENTEYVKKNFTDLYRDLKEVKRAQQFSDERLKTYEDQFSGATKALKWIYSVLGSIAAAITAAVIWVLTKVGIL